MRSKIFLFSLALSISVLALISSCSKESTAEVYYTLTVTPDSGGSVNIFNVFTIAGKELSIAGAKGKEVTVYAIPVDGYSFSNWSDTNTSNPRTFILNSDLSIGAYFSAN